MKYASLLLLFIFTALGLSAQTPISTQSGIVPVHNLRVEDTTFYGQLIGIWAIDAGDTMFGFVPVYVLPDSTLLVGSDTVYTTGNGQVVTLTGQVLGSGTTSITTTLANGDRGDVDVTSGGATWTIDTNAVTSIKIANGAVGLTTKVTGVLPIANGGTNLSALGTAGQVLRVNSGATALEYGTPTSGTVTSVGLTVPTGLTVTGSPVTSTGTLAVSTTLNGPLRGNGSGFTTGNTNLASEVTGTLPVANGGTGATTLTANKVLVGNGTSAITQATNLHWDNTNSRLGIGTSSPVSRLSIIGTLNTEQAINIGTTFTGGTSRFGILQYNTVATDVTANAFNYYSQLLTSAETFTIDRVVDYWAAVTTLGAGSTINNVIKFYASSVTAGNNNYSFYSNQASGTNNYALYMNGSAKNYLAGDVGIGTTSPAQKIHVVGSSYVSGQYLSNPASTALAPAFSFDTDADNGMFRPTTNTVAFSTAGTERARFDASGNFGIATSSPSQPLHVSGNARITGAIYDSNNDPGTAGQILSTTATGTDWIAATSGTVTSVALTMPTGFSVSGSPVTSTGTLAVSTTLNGPLRGNGSGFTTGNTNLASEVTGTLPVANGGTGATTLTANKVLIGNGTSAITQATNLHWDNSNSRLGISQTSPAYPLDISATSAIRLPVGTLAQQPAAATGLLRYTSNSSTIEWSDGSNWYTGISGEGNGPSASFNRVALWSGTSTQTSDADMTFNISTGQLKLLKYSSGTAFTGTSVAQLHVTSTGEVITKSPRDTQYVHLVAVNPGTAVTQTAGTNFFQGSFLMPENLDNYTLSRADYAITNSTATTGSLTVAINYYNTTNSSQGTACAVTFNGSDVRKSSTNGLVMPKGYWMHAKVGVSNGTLNNTVEGLLITLMFTK